MEQLIMRWKNTGREAKMPDFGDFVCRTFTESDEDIDKWAEIVQHGLTEQKATKEDYFNIMYDHGPLELDKFFLIEKDGQPAATIAIICNYEKKEGYIHMVGSHPAYRGLGLGNKMNELAVKVLVDAGMETAYLTTDDWRIPAIKSYLRSGFEPDRSTADFAERWDKIYREIGRK